MSARASKLESHKGDMPLIWTERGLRSGASWIASADAAVQEQFLNELDEGELLALPYLFDFWAMDHQLPPEGSWRTWVVLGGRGAGKTRAGAEWVRSMVEGAKPFDPGACTRVALVGETIEQVREVMVFGDSGVLACSPEDRRPVWESGRKRLVWPNGAIATVHTAHDPEALRGPQFDAAWVDEYGCAAVNKGSNQPNKFLDRKSSESRLPYYSTGARDELMQLQYLRAMSEYWNDPRHNPLSPEYDGRMLDMSRAFVWAFDTRPYPFFPNNLTKWSDGDNYTRGHWINGRTAGRSLASVVGEICRRAGLVNFRTEGLYGYVRGYAVEQVTDARAALQPLMIRYGFDAIERDGVLQFRMRDGVKAVTLDPERLAVTSELDGTAEQVREADAEVSGRMRLRFVQADADFDVIAEEAVLADEATHAVSGSEVNIALTRGEGRQIAERWLTEARVARDTVRLALPPSQIALGAGDVFELPGDANEGPALYRIDRVEQSDVQLLEGVRIEPQVYDLADIYDEVVQARPFVAPVPVLSHFMDLPLLRGDEVPHAPHLAATAQPWPGPVAVFQSSTDANYELSKVIGTRSTMGITRTSLPAARAGVIDRGDVLEVELVSGSLSSVSEEALLSGANMAAIGDGSYDKWEVFQFAEAELVAPRTYWLKTRLRGQAGSDGLMPGSWPSGSSFVLLDGTPSQLDLSPNLRRVAQNFRIGPARRGYDDPSYRHRIVAFDGNGLRPYVPCHLRFRETATGDYELDWIRRTRIDGDGWETPEVPLGEESESYVVRVMQNGAVLREEMVAHPSFHYSAAMQASDSLASPFDVAVAQVSATYGTGPFQTVRIAE